MSYSSFDADYQNMFAGLDQYGSFHMVALGLEPAICETESEAITNKYGSAEGKNCNMELYKLPAPKTCILENAKKKYPSGPDCARFEPPTFVEKRQAPMSSVQRVMAKRAQKIRADKERAAKKREAEARKAEIESRKQPKPTLLPVDDYPQPAPPARAPDTTTVEEAYGRRHSHRPPPAPTRPTSIAPDDARPCDVRGPALFKPQRQKASSRRMHSHTQPKPLRVPRIPTPPPAPAPASPRAPRPYFDAHGQLHWSDGEYVDCPPYPPCERKESALTIMMDHLHDVFHDALLRSSRPLAQHEHDLGPWRNTRRVLPLVCSATRAQRALILTQGFYYPVSHETARHDKTSRRTRRAQHAIHHKPNARATRGAWGTYQTFASCLIGTAALAVAYVWLTDHSAWNRLMHALHGNGIKRSIDDVYSCYSPQAPHWEEAMEAELHYLTVNGMHKQVCSLPPSGTHAWLSAAPDATLGSVGISDAISLRLWETDRAAAVEYIWAIDHKAWNKLMHALHGNGIISRIYTDGMPTLKANNTLEDYISWTIDFKAWCRGQGIYGCIISRPAAPPRDPKGRRSRRPALPRGRNQRYRHPDCCGERSQRLRP